MTLSKLLGYTAAEWESLDDTALEGILSPYFKVTRPELGKVGKSAAKPVTGKSNRDVKKLMTDVKQLMLQAGVCLTCGLVKGECKCQ